MFNVYNIKYNCLCIKNVNLSVKIISHNSLFKDNNVYYLNGCNNMIRIVTDISHPDGLFDIDIYNNSNKTIYSEIDINDDKQKNSILIYPYYEKKCYIGLKFSDIIKGNVKIYLYDFYEKINDLCYDINNEYIDIKESLKKKYDIHEDCIKCECIENNLGTKSIIKNNGKIEKIDGIFNYISKIELFVKY